jgi:LPS export ABC transporter protein LptC
MRLGVRMMVAAAVALWLAGACGREQGGGARGHEGELPEEIVSDFTTEETDSGRIRWRLSAPEARRFAERKVFVMDEPRIQFFDEDGHLQTTLTSRSGEYLLDSHDMVAYGDVVVVSVEGDVLETDSLRYVNQTDRIVSDSFVKLTRGNDVVTGYGLECDHELGSVDIKRDVKARIVDEQGNIVQ